MSDWKVIAADFDATSRAVFTVTKGSKCLDHREQGELEALLGGWISVDDRLPPMSHDPILLWNGRWAYVGKYLDTLKDGPAFTIRMMTCYREISLCGCR